MSYLYVWYANLDLINLVLQKLLIILYKLINFNFKF